MAVKDTLYGAGILGLNRLAAGFDLTEEELKRHLAGKPYRNQTIVNNAVSDATDGYHIRSGKDYGQLAKGNLPLGGIPAALAGIAYQQMDGIADSSIWDGNLSNPFGTFGKNAFLQSVDNIEGLRQSGNAPALDAMYEFGGNVYNLFNQPSTPSLDITALGGPRTKGNFTKGTINVEDYSTKVARIQAKKEAEARARAQAELQARAQAEAKAQQAISQRQEQQSQAQQQQLRLPTMNTPSNMTKFGPTRSTAIKGGRGGRGNVGGNRMKAGTSKNYGVTGRRVTGGR